MKKNKKKEKGKKRRKIEKKKKKNAVWSGGTEKAGPPKLRCSISRAFRSSVDRSLDSTWASGHQPGTRDSLISLS